MTNTNIIDAFLKTHQLALPWQTWQTSDCLALFEILKHHPKENIESLQYRNLALHLLKKGKIDLSEYGAIFNTEIIHQLDVDPSHSHFIECGSQQDQTELTQIYSLAKYGSMSAIDHLAKRAFAYLSQQLDDPNSHWSRLFHRAQSENDAIVFLTTGWRNAPSTANIVYEKVVKNLNVKLASMNLPTINNVKLPRIAPPCENYASLSLAERNYVNLHQDHVLPDCNFYAHQNVHVIFGDDVLITGATGDKIFYSAMNKGASSFQALYLLGVNPMLAMQNAEVEEFLNTRKVKNNCIDDTVIAFLSERKFTPILRTLRFLLSNTQPAQFEDLLHRVPNDNLLKIYLSALNNDFHQQVTCQANLNRLADYLTEHARLSPSQYFE